MKKVSIIVGDSQYLTRNGLEGLITNQEDFDLLALTSSGEELLSQIAKQKPAVAILDYLSNEFNLETIREIKQRAPETRVLVISADLVRDNIFKSIEFGANSFVTKNCSAQEIINAIIATSKDERFFCNRILEVFIDNEHNGATHSQPNDLTNREVEILQLIGKGYSTKELASLLHLSQHTIYTHRKNMMKKFGVSSSTDMILAAVNSGLIKPTSKSA